MREALQQEMAFLGALTSELKQLDRDLVKRYSSHAEACHLCMQFSRVHRTQDEWADVIGMNRSQFKQCISTGGKRVKNLPAEKEEELQKAAGNLALTQWRELYRNGELHCQQDKEAREAELLRELAHIRATA